MIPTGFTRHLIPGRALGLNLNLDLLKELHTEGRRSVTSGGSSMISR